MTDRKPVEPPIPQTGGDVTQYDGKSLWRCPQLGGPVTFEYCRKMNGGLPCVRLTPCWGETFDVQTFLTAHYDEDQLERIQAGVGRGRMDIISQTLQRVLADRQADTPTDARE